MNILIATPKYGFYGLGNKPDFAYAFPLGLAYISAVLKKAKYNVDVLNLSHINGSPKDILNRALNRKKYDFVLTGGNALLYLALEEILTTARSHPSHPITILGGTIVTSEPELSVSSLKPDYAVIGEGEYAIIELLQALKNKSPLSNVSGIIFFDNGRIVKTSSRPQIENIEKIPLPDFEGFEFSKYLDNMHENDFFYNQVFDYPRTYPILGSRGCPFNCTFCWHPTKYRARSIKDIMKELQVNVPKYKINNILLYDDCFSATQDRVYEFCREIKKLKQKISWDLRWTCQLLVKSVDEKMLKAMKEAGCEIISYGFESYSPIVLKSMKKPISPQEIDNAIRKTLDAGMAVAGHFIFGDIAETKETARETLNYWKFKCPGHQAGMAFIQPYPGSELYSYCLKNGLIKDKLKYLKYEMGPFNNINMTSMSNEEFKKLEKEVLNAYAKYTKFVVPISIKKEKENIYAIMVKCPFCGKIIEYKNCFIKNRANFGFYLTCRNCHMRYFAVSLAQKIAYKYYSLTRQIRDVYKKIRNVLANKKSY